MVTQQQNIWTMKIPIKSIVLEVVINEEWISINEDNGYKPFTV